MLCNLAQTHAQFATLLKAPQETYFWNYVVNFNLKFLLHEKRDRAVEKARKERKQELTKEEIKETRSEVPMVGRQEIGRVPDLDDEDAKKEKTQDKCREGKKDGTREPAERE